MKSEQPSVEDQDMENFIRFGLLIPVLAGGTWAQTMLEHAAVTGPAATGASAGAVIGNKVGHIFGAVGTSVEAASKMGTKAADPKPVAKPGEAKSTNVAPMPGFLSGPSPASAGPKPLRAEAISRNSVPAETVATQILNSVPSLPPPPPAAAALTREQLLAELPNIQPGLGRGEVLSKLGAPAYKLAYDDGGRIVERFRFRADGQDVVLVELKDGIVESARSLIK